MEIISKLKLQANQWRLLPKLSYRNFRKLYPNMVDGCFGSWFKVQRYWGGRIINISVKHHVVVLDFRKNWLADLVKPN